MIIRPQPGPQEKFLSSSADVVFFGGGAGGGKTWALLMEPLRHYNVSGFTSLTFRRSAVEIRSPGGLWDGSQKLYNQLDSAIKPIPREQQLDWSFSSGATIKFAHLMNDNTVYEYQGSELCLLQFDEICHFSFLQFTYLLSRNRSNCGVKPYVRATCNPDKDSWVRTFIDWWVGDDGLIIPERIGVIRYFHIIDQEIHWADTAEELMHFFSEKEIEVGAKPRSFTFIPANIYDNKILLEKDPNYISSLKSQNIVDRERLLGGNWNISLSDYGAVLSRNDFFRYDFNEKLNIAGFFTESYFVLDGASRTKNSSDYSVLGLFAKSRWDKYWYIVDWVRVKLLEPDLEKLIIDKWNQWRPILKPKGINIETASVGLGLIVRLPRAGIPCFELKPDKDKFHRLNDGLGYIKGKMIGIPDGASWASKFFEECESFRADGKHATMMGEIKGYDDQVDVLAYGISTQINKRSFVELANKKKTWRRPQHGAWLRNN